MFKLLKNAYYADKIVLSMPKTASTAVAKHMGAIHLHSVYDLPATKANRHLLSYPGRKQSKFLYLILLRSILKIRKREYFVIFRNENDRMLSSFIHDFCFCYVYSDLLGKIDSRSLTNKDIEVIAETSLDFSFLKKWVFLHSTFLRIDSLILTDLATQGSNLRLTSIENNLGTISFIGQNYISEDLGVSKFTNARRSKPWLENEDLLTGVIELIENKIEDV